MTSINTLGRIGTLDRKNAVEGDRGSVRPMTIKPFSRERTEASSIDGMRRLFGRDKPSPRNADVAMPYVRHHTGANANANANANIVPSAPPAHLMPPEALLPEHRNPVVASAPPAHLMPQEALRPEHQNVVLANGFQQLARR